MGLRWSLVWRVQRFTSNLSPRRIWRDALMALLLSGGAAAQAANPPVEIRSPQQQFQELYVAVEEARLFADSKAFADATPRSAPDLPRPAHRKR
jgi:hypothetical protein